MKYNTINGDLTTASGKNLDSEILSQMARMKQIDSHMNIDCIYDLSDIGLDINTVTLEDIGKRIPTNCKVILSLSWSAIYAEKLIPTVSNNGVGKYFSGVLVVEKYTFGGRAYFEYRAREFIATCGYSSDSAVKITGWQYSPAAMINIRPTPDNFGNKISNIYIPGEYYFTSSQIALFSDKPPTNLSGFLSVINSGTEKGADKKFTYTENNSECRSWVMIGSSGKWVSIPCVHLSPLPDDRLRIGDMKINSNGNLMIKTSADKVKEL